MSQPFSPIAGKLWLSCHATLHPPVTDAELASLLPGEIAFWHPDTGLVAFGPADTMRVHELLEAPAATASDWTHAKPGVASAARLLSAAPQDPPNLEALLHLSRGDIGTRSREEMPPAPGEAPPVPGGLRGVARWIGRNLARALNAMLSGKPVPGDQGEAKPNWLDRLREWSANVVQRLTPEIQQARDREIGRLLHLLEHDPDQGLRFALPMGTSAVRGMAPPGAILGPRDPSFDMTRLGSVRAADPWDLPWNVQQDLIKRYRELAMRELRLGRHRRAAYIFAELLADFRAAADALQEGRHYREAAVLYRDRLRQPLLAAACLERGGLLLDAISLYETEGKYESAGDLYAKIERPDDAARAWRQAAEQLREKGDPLSAGRLLESKLAAPDEALALWNVAWPWSHQAGPCLEARFDLLGRLGRHDDSLKSVASLSKEALAPSRVGVLARALGNVSHGYPDRRTRDRAADAARMVVGARLPQADPAEAEELLRSVTRLVPEDRLLARDAGRFASARRGSVAPHPKPRGPAWTPLLSVQLQLPGDIMWETAAARRDMLYVAGFGRGGAVLARLPWTEEVQVLTWTPHLNYPHILEPGLDPDRPVLFAGSPGPRLGLLTFPATNKVPHATPAGTPPWFPDDVLGAAVSDLGTVWVVREHLGRLVVWAYTQGGSISAIHPLPQLEEALPPGESLASFAPLPCVAQRLNLFVALGTRLVRLGRDGSVAVADLPEPALALHASTPSARPMIAVAFEHGGAVLWDGPNLSRVRRFGDDLAGPLLSFTRDATLVAIGDKEGRVYDTTDERVLEKGTFPTIGGRPVAAVEGPKQNEFALVMPEGEVRVYRIPRVT